MVVIFRGFLHANRHASTIFLSTEKRDYRAILLPVLFFGAVLRTKGIVTRPLNLDADYFSRPAWIRRTTEVAIKGNTYPGDGITDVERPIVLTWRRIYEGQR